MPRLQVFAAAVTLVGTACDLPSPYIERNASDPIPGGSAARLANLKSETSMVYVSYAGEHRVLLAYNDEAGAFTADVMAGTTTLKPNWSYAGLSLSKDGGQSWILKGPLPPNPSGTEPVCVTGLRSDPWLATNGNRILYSDMAATAPNPQPGDGANAVAVAHSDDGGDTWSPFRVAALETEVDKPSIALNGNTAVIAYVVGVDIRIATSEDGGDDWGPPQTLVPAPAFTAEQTPIVKLVTPVLGYVAFMQLSGTTHGVHVVRIDRTGIGASWTPTEIYVRNGLQADYDIPAALDRSWADPVPLGFDVAEDGSLLVVQRLAVDIVDGTPVNASVVELRRCPGNCLSLADFDQVLFLPRGQGQNMYQPGVSAAHF